jgi:hypothetical protein
MPENINYFITFSLSVVKDITVILYDVFVEFCNHRYDEAIEKSTVMQLHC